MLTTCILLLQLLLLLLPSSTFLFILHSVSRYRTAYFKCVIHFKIMRKNILAVSAVCFHISQINVFPFSFLLCFLCSVWKWRTSRTMCECFCISACCWFLSESSLCDHFFFLCDSKIFYVEFDKLSNKLIYSGKLMCFLLFFLFFYSFSC